MTTARMSFFFFFCVCVCTCVTLILRRTSPSVTAFHLFPPFLFLWFVPFLPFHVFTFWKTSVSFLFVWLSGFWRTHTRIAGFITYIVQPNLNRWSSPVFFFFSFPDRAHTELCVDVVFYLLPSISKKELSRTSKKKESNAGCANLCFATHDEDNRALADELKTAHFFFFSSLV